MNKRIKFILTLLFIGLTAETVSARAYWVFFSDKDGVSYNPYLYFDAKAIERRLKNGISLYNSGDLPVRYDYVEGVKQVCSEIHTVSRWFNAVSVHASLQELQKINDLPFVLEVKPIKQYTQRNGFITAQWQELSPDMDRLLENQIHSMEGEEFIKSGINGKGIRIAVFDAGFPGVDEHPAFQHLFENNQIIATYDFFANKENVYKKSTHGSSVLACIAGMHNGKNIGLATGAEYLLARTESSLTEFKNEEENWLNALEWADKHGADIVSSSLGYTYHRYFVTDMDGKTSMVSLAAQKARDYGILVINAMGNDGDGKWQVMGTPADAENVMSVGGIDPDSDLRINFSSVGPTVDFRRKPNVSAFGKVVTCNGEKMTTSYGTSFSTPLIAGFAACVWQMNEDATAEEVFKLIENSGSLFPYYDYAHGYGIPQASFFTVIDEKEETPSFTITVDEDKIVVNLTDQYLNSARKGMDRYFFYHSEKNNHLKYYAVLNTAQQEVLTLDKSTLEEDAIIRFHCNGYTYTFENN